MLRRKGQTIKSGSREIIGHIIDICEQEAANECLKLPLKAKTKRAALYAGVGESSIKRIKGELFEKNRHSPDRPLKSPGKKRPRASVVSKVDDFDFQVIRNTIEEFYLTLKRVPTCSQLLQKIREKIEFPWGRRTLNSFLKKKGFVWRKCKNKRKILMERPQIMQWRLHYLRAIKKYQQENRTIIYQDETWLDNDMTVRKCWQSDEHKIFGVPSGMRSGGKYFIPLVLKIC